MMEAHAVETNRNKIFVTLNNRGFKLLTSIQLSMAFDFFSLYAFSVAYFSLAFRFKEIAGVGGFLLNAMTHACLQD